MGKLFLETFPTLNLPDSLEKALSAAEVTKITTNSEHTKLVVYLESSQLLSKEQVHVTEKQLKKQLVQPGQNMTVRIEESFRLSGQYTPENIWHSYKDSMYYELRRRDMILLQILQRCEVTFSGEKDIHILLDRNIMNTGREKQLIAYFIDVFEKRCNVPVRVHVDYNENPKDAEKVRHEKKMAREIEMILKQTAGLPQAPSGEIEEVPLPWDDGGEEGEHPYMKKDPEDTAWGRGAKTSGKKDDKDKDRPAKKYAYSGSYKAKAEDDPNLIWGRTFDEDPVPLKEVMSEMGQIAVEGRIFLTEEKTYHDKRRDEDRVIYIFSLTDESDSISVKLFLSPDEMKELKEELDVGSFVRVRGTTVIDPFDSELVIGSVYGIRKASDNRACRMDLSPEKRVELHCHTKMSDMDGVSAVEDIIAEADSWNMDAVAVTDHGVVHAFPDAFHKVQKVNKKRKKDGRPPMKIIYGMEGYLVDDLVELVRHEKGQSLDDVFVVFDIETTGFNAISNRIIEIGAVKIKGDRVLDRFQSYVDPKVPIPPEITELTKITDEMVMEADPIETVLPAFLAFAGDAPLVGHNVGFDLGFIEQNCRNQEIPFSPTSVDTMTISRTLLPTMGKYTLDAVAKELGVSLENHHRADDDAECTAYIFMQLSRMLKERGVTKLSGINSLGGMSRHAVVRLHPYHIILLAKNEEGRKNLYRLVSKSHLEYFNRRPLLPKSEIIKYREGLIIGSACEAGELFQAVVEGKSDDRLSEMASFYDYLEIQPIGNNRFMIGSKRSPHIRSDEDLKDLNRRIVSLGEKLKKPVAATCDVHFLRPEDEIYRRIIMAGEKYEDADDQPPLYFRTTEEMLQEFDYLGEAKAKEVVITNTRRISDMIEYIEPVRPEKCPPVIENSDQILRDCCYDKAHSMYGEELPKIVTDRLETELNSIISNGYSVMYIIARKLVLKANEDGYMVGSRGSVGSSLAATMSGITEVNPLPPHYYCKKCHFTDFDSELVQEYVKKGACGWDMPRRKCPVCGEDLSRDGFNIPFETFLGFKGDKEPDIDLNFSGVYQATAHKYTEEIFGEGHTFKAGTIATVAENTAFGFVKGYYDERHIHKRKCEIERLKNGVTGVRRTTGQHPGGIIVLPYGEEIDTFTPVQHPANKQTDIITTHFDYHSIDHNLLKLDILGHDDPTIIRQIEEATGISVKDILLDDPDVMSLFAGTEALGIEPDDIHGTKLGTLGIPEFGTDFVIQMVQEAKPKTFSDLVRISGLSHGTNVWVDNAQTLLREGKATIESVISLRDDIMTYLIQNGLESTEAFQIMENVRKKGKDLTPEQETHMREAGIPEWYIWSCHRITYMFPKAHAAAYCMSAYRIAYCKIRYPLAYYASYFSVRSIGFDYETICQGLTKLRYAMDELLSLEKTRKLTATEKDTLRDMRIAEEMYARGYEFMPIDIYRAKATDVTIIDGKLMPALTCIKDMGSAAAAAVVEEAAKERFLSLADFRDRTKVPQKVAEYMLENGMLGDIPKSDQISLFDFR